MEKIHISNNIYFTDLLTMGKNVYLYPGRFYALFNKPIFAKILRKEDPKKYQEFINIKRQNYMPDIFVFKVSYLLNPYMRLRYHRFKFDTYKELGETMLSYGPIVDVYLKDLIVYHLLSEYMERMRDDKACAKLYKYVKEAEKSSLTNPNFAYWTLAFQLASSKTLIYKNHKFTKPEDFFRETSVLTDLFSFSSSFLKNQCVIAWLSFLGYTEKVNRFKSLSNLSDSKENEVSKMLAKELAKEFIH
ncbi:MAG: hypothetical protein WCR63_03795 [Bacilli bacterium]